MFPFVYSPTYEYPFSGDVTQGISPSFSWEIEGIPEVEYEVVTTVASYGKQLGKLTEAVLALAEKTGLEGEEIEAVRKIAAGVEEAKLRARDAARARAEKAAERAEKLEKLG
jgi:hypothetical protein